MINFIVYTRTIRCRFCTALFCIFTFIYFNVYLLACKVFLILFWKKYTLVSFTTSLEYFEEKYLSCLPPCTFLPPKFDLRVTSARAGHILTLKSVSVIKNHLLNNFHFVRNLSSERFRPIWAVEPIEFAKLRAFHPHVSYVPTCLFILRTWMPSCLKLLCAFVLRAYVPRNYYVPTSTHFSRAYVSTCLRAYMYIFHVYVASCFKLFRTYVRSSFMCCFVILTGAYAETTIWGPIKKLSKTMSTF